MTTDENKDNPLLPKLKKLYDLKLENDEELLDGLKSLSLIFGENNIRNRRNLRSTIERQGVDIRKTTLKEFKSVVEEIRKINEETKSMNNKCLAMSDRLSKTKCQTRELIEKTTKLQLESQKFEMKKKVAEAFCSRFQVSNEDISILTNKESQVDEQFLASLERLRDVEADCRLLVRLQDQTLGLETLEMVSSLSDSAYERLFIWTRSSIGKMSQMGECEVGEGLAIAVARLGERPVLLRHILDEFRAARRQAIGREFDLSLSELEKWHSHDSLRLASDMLAVVHQLAASEREHLRALLRLVSHNINDDIVTDESTNEQIDFHSPDVACEGLCRPFKARMEQLLVPEQDTVTLYKIFNLLKFYKTTLSPIVSGALPNSIQEIQMLAWRLFCGRLQSNVSATGLSSSGSFNNPSAVTKESCPRIPHGLEPPIVCKTALHMLEEVLTARDLSMTSSSTDNNKLELQQILQLVIDPVLQYCSLVASNNTNINPVDAAVFLSNCLYDCQSTLAKFEFTGSKLEQIQGQLDANLDSLISFQAGYVIRGCGMAQLYELLETTNVEHCSSQGAPLDFKLSDRVPESALKSMMVSFDGYLSHPDSLVLPQLSLLTSAKLRLITRKRSHDLVHQAYQRMYNAVRDSDVSGYKDACGIMPRTPEQVADLILNC